MTVVKRCCARYIGWYLKLLDPIFLGIYVVELAIKVYALRVYFFKDAWNWFGQLTLMYTTVVCCKVRLCVMCI